MPSIVVCDPQAENTEWMELIAPLHGGTDVRVFAKGSLLLKAFPNDSIDLVIITATVQDIPAIDLVQRVRNLSGHEHLPIVFVLPHEDRSLRLQALEAGSSEFISAPVDSVDLMMRTYQLLDYSRIRKELEKTATEISFLRASFEQIPAKLSLLDRHRNYFAISNETASFIGKPQTDIIGKKPETVLHPKDPAINQTFEREILANGALLPAREEELVDGTGTLHPHMTARGPVKDASGRIIGVISCSLPSQKTSVNAKPVSDTDKLTGLYTRSMAEGIISETIKACAAVGEPFALYLVRMKGLRSINTTFGHTIGDRFIVAAARRLKALAEETLRGTFLIARFSGEEFLIIQNSIHDPNVIETFGRKLIEQMGATFQIAGSEVESEATVGIALYPNNGATTVELLAEISRAIDVTVEGTAPQPVYVSAPAVQHLEPEDMRQLVDRALSGNQLVMHYQPQINLQQGKIMGMEALLRWDRPGAGLIGPGSLFQAASAYGQLPALSDWILRQILEDATMFRESGLADITISMNISREQLDTPETRSVLLDIMHKAPTASRLIDLESNGRDLFDTAMQLALFSEMCGSHTVDCGDEDPMFVFSRPGAPPFHRIKLSMASEYAEASRLSQLIDTAHGFGLKVIGTNIEHSDHLVRVREANLDIAQGYFVHRPIAVDELIAQIRNGEF